MTKISAHVGLLLFAVFDTAAASLEWSIESDTPAVEATFDQSSSNIAFHFNKTMDRDHKFALYATKMTPGTTNDPEYQCDMSSSVALSTTNPNDSIRSTTDGQTYFTYDVAVDTKTISNSPVWTQVGNDATIAFCARVDLYQPIDNSDDVDVSFLEVPVIITLDLTSDFATVSSIELERTAATVVNEDATVNYELEVCQCNTAEATPETRCTGSVTTGVSSKIMSQNSNLELCVNTKSEDVEIVQIQSLLIRQVSGTPTDEFIYAIGGGTPDGPTNDGTVSVLTAYDPIISHIHNVTTRLVSKFFPAGVATPSIAVTGQALLQFKASGRRQLADITIGRSLQNQDVSAFEMIVELENGEISETANVDVEVNEVSGAEAVLGSAAVLVLLQAIAM